MTDFPTRDAILSWIAANPSKSGKNDIARAFGLRGDDRIVLKALLREMKADGTLSRGRGGFHATDSLPPVLVITVSHSKEGDLFARPERWDGTGDPPAIHVIPGKRPLAVGDRVLARMTRGTEAWEARPIKRIGGPEHGPGRRADRRLGIYRTGPAGGRLVPIDKRADSEWRIQGSDAGGAQEGELVRAERIGRRRAMSLPDARVIERLGDAMAPKCFSLIAIHEHGIPDQFPETVLEAAAAMPPAPMGAREDLRHLPLITIDPADARDHDDAIAAMPREGGGHILWIAIADVAHYVRPDSPIDLEAQERGNSVYFPDRVVPMLPERLSTDLCSLREGEDRPAILARIEIDDDGVPLARSFHRAMIRVAAGVSYEQAQAAADGVPETVSATVMRDGIQPLWNAYAALKRAKTARAPLDLDLPERRIVLSEAGKVESVDFRDRFAAHMLVEAFMIAANVAAAEAVQEGGLPLLYRVHEAPPEDKVTALARLAESLGLSLARGQRLTTKSVNRLLVAARDRDDVEAIHISVLRTMTQAYYGTRNEGHFGLNLGRYAHFTSPIRRYADLTLHRALYALHRWEGASPVPAWEDLAQTGEAISQTERRAMTAERDTADRYLAAWLGDRVGTEFTGRVSGVAAFGLFIKLDGSGADGLIPVSRLGHEFFRYDKRDERLIGESSGRAIGLGDQVAVRLVEAAPVSGGILLELLSVEGKSMPTPPRAGARKKKGRKPFKRRKG